MATSIIKLDDTGWITLNSTYPTRYRKKNGFVTIALRLDGGPAPPSSGAYTLGYLPEGFRPSFSMGTVGANQRCTLNVAYDNGGVSIQQNSGGYSEYMNANITYPV